MAEQEKRRVYRGDEGSGAVQFGTPERIEFHLFNWARWKRSGGHQGAMGAVAVGLSSGGASQHFDDMVDESDRRCARITDTVIEDLAPVEHCAVHNAYLEAVFRFSRETFEDVLARAKAKIGRGLAARGVY